MFGVALRAAYHWNRNWYLCYNCSGTCATITVVLVLQLSGTCATFE